MPMPCCPRRPGPAESAGKRVATTAIDSTTPKTPPSAVASSAMSRGFQLVLCNPAHVQTITKYTTQLQNYA
ncbi:hypothetical protein C6341_g13415 [Phytophthora cactorum]|nr:hypothetical protein C6341_g13415 [Phytophthora cactorum]